MSASSSNALFANRSASLSLPSRGLPVRSSRLPHTDTVEPTAVSRRRPAREIDVDVFVAIVILTAVLALALTRALRARRGHRTDQQGMDPGVTLSVLPGRLAIVTLDAEPDRSAAAAHLVDQAVRDAFTLEGVDEVEVRRTDGELLERRLRPAPG